MNKIPNSCILGKISLPKTHTFPTCCNLTSKIKVIYTLLNSHILHYTENVIISMIQMQLVTYLQTCTHNAYLYVGHVSKFLVVLNVLYFHARETIA